MSLIERTLQAIGLQSVQASSQDPDERKRQISAVTGLPVGRLELYERALRHSSLLRQQSDTGLKSNERLEFLGDAVLGMAAAEYLFARFPERDEGFLTRLRAKLVNKQALTKYAIKVGPRPADRNELRHGSIGRSRESVASRQRF